MTEISKKLRDFVDENGTEMNAEFDRILASFNPPKPLRVKELVLKGDRGHIVVYEDDECIILMNT